MNIKRNRLLLSEVSDVCVWAAFPDCTGCHNTKCSITDCPALFMFSLWELGSDFSLNTSFTACYSDSTKSIHTLNTKQRMKGIMETEKDTTEKVELHCTSTLQVSFIPIIFFETVFFFQNTCNLVCMQKDFCVHPICHYSLALNYHTLINCAMKIYLLIQITSICKARLVDTGNISYQTK